MPKLLSGAKQGSLPLGKDAKRLRMLWDAPATSLRMDLDDDGKFTPAETFVPTTTPREFAIVIDGAKRTLMVRLRGEAPVFAVRGHVVGTVTIAGKELNYLRTDGDSDGCFHTPGRDRLLLDADADGKPDPLTERFAVGDAIKIGDDRFLISPSPDGTTMTVCKRPTE